MQETEIKILIDKIINRDRKAFEKLYDDYCAALYTLTLKILGQQEHLAEDALQETFLKIWNSIHTYNADKGSIYTWMLNIARNTAIDKLRANKKNNKNQSLENNVITINKKIYDTQKTDGIGLYEVLNTLLPEQKILIEMAYYQGYTQEEIAQALNIPLGTVKTRMRAAMLDLRNKLNVSEFGR